MEEKQRLSKALYKVLIYLIKTIPFITAGIYASDLFLQFLGIDFVVLSYIATMSIMSWTFMYIASWVFKFCTFHRLPLYYILVEDLFVVSDNYLKFPLSAIHLYEIHFAIIGIFIILLLHYHQKQIKNDKNIKRTAIKDSR